MKKQKMIIGGIIKIPLSANKIVLGKLLKEGFVVVYNKVLEADKIINLSEIDKSDRLLYADIFKDIITKGYFEIIGQSSVANENLRKIPPQFKMETAHPELCTLLYADGTDKKVLPSECIGLEYIYIWNESGLVELIEDRITGRLNKYDKLIHKQIEQGLAIEKELGMKVPWQWWEYNPASQIMGYDSLVGRQPHEWASIIQASRLVGGKNDEEYDQKLSVQRIAMEKERIMKLLFNREEFQLLINKNRNINKNFPFEIDDDGLIRASIEKEPLWPGYCNLFEKLGYSGNGYCWEGHIEQILEQLAPELLNHIDFDPEAGAFFANADSKETQQQFVTTLSPIFSNTDELEKWIKKADHSRIDD